MKRWLIEKDLWFIIEDKSDLNTFNSIINIISEIQSFDFESQKINAKAHYWLIICIIINDQEHTADKMLAKKIWNALSYKYKKKLQIIERQYLMNFMITECQWISLLKRHEYISSSWLERSLQHRMI